MKYKHALITLFAGGSFSIYAQQSQNAAGGEAGSATGSVSYSVGQVSYQTFSQNGAIVNEGIQQPFELIALTVKEGQQIHVSVFPNPSSDYFILEFPVESRNRNYSLRDLSGRLLIKGELSDLKNSIPAHDLAPAEYLLEITEGSNAQTFKLIKN